MTDDNRNEKVGRGGGKGEIDRLLDIMAALRTPGTGCPWDLEQTFATIVPYTLEEAHEVAEAIENDDMEALRKELGDLLFQVVFHARLAEEAGVFSFDDVVRAVCDKMVRRHPHVFGGQKAAMSNEDIRGQWERIKDAEKTGGKNGEKKTERPAASILDGVPPTLPALSRSVKLQEKAARTGFDWPSLAPVFDKMREELAELEQELTGQDEEKRSSAERRAAIEDEYGDVLFVMANVGRHLGLDPEQALRRANRKFVRRFHVMENILHQRGKSPLDSCLEEMEELWSIAKQRENRPR